MILQILKIIGLAYIILEVFISCLVMFPGALTVVVYIEGAKLILGKYACKVGVHNWKYHNETFDIEGLPHINEVTGHIRKCSGVCYREQYRFDNFTAYKDGHLEGTLIAKRV
jgi:hypothetical protein